MCKTDQSLCIAHMRHSLSRSLKGVNLMLRKDRPKVIGHDVAFVLNDDQFHRASPQSERFSAKALYRITVFLYHDVKD